MIKILFSGAVVLTLVLFSSLWLYAHSFDAQVPSRPLLTTINVYTNGHARQLSGSDASLTQYKALVEAALYNAPAGIYSASSKADLVGSPGTAVEILYPSAVRLTKRSLSLPGVIIVDRIIIKLSGESERWVLFGDGFYGNSPYASDSSTTIASLIKLVSNEDLLK